MPDWWRWDSVKIILPYWQDNIYTELDFVVQFQRICHAQKGTNHDLLGRKFVEVAFALITPHQHAINADEISANPTFPTTVGLGTQQREIASIIDL